MMNDQDDTNADGEDATASQGCSGSPAGDEISAGAPAMDGDGGEMTLEDSDEDAESDDEGEDVIWRDATLVNGFLKEHERWTSREQILAKLEEGESIDRPVATGEDEDELQFSDGKRKSCRSDGAEKKSPPRPAAATAEERRRGEEPQKKAAADAEEGASISPERLSEALFRPGMKFMGRICIPNMGDGPERSGDDGEEGRGGELSARRYELVVLERGEDRLGNEFIYARHSAYGDEQYINICLNVDDADVDGRRVGDDSGDKGASWREEGNGEGRSRVLCVHYEDGETCCSGRWNPELCRLEGHVRQRVRADDGIFHASDGAMHVFTLHPCTGRFPMGRREEECIALRSAPRLERPPDFEQDILSEDTRDLAARRRRIYGAVQGCFQSFLVLFRVVRVTSKDVRAIRLFRAAETNEERSLAPLSRKQKLLWTTRVVRWTDLLRESFSVGAGRACAGFRFGASLLESIEFETSRDRIDFVRRWGEARMDPASAGDLRDCREFLMQALMRMAHAFRSDGENVPSGLKARVRLRASYECLEGAYRRAESRLSNEELARYRLSTQKRILELKDFTCVICQSDHADFADHLYELPCKHRFHGRCIRRWLHGNSICPVCRYDLKDDAIEDVGSHNEGGQSRND